MTDIHAVLRCFLGMRVQDKIGGADLCPVLIIGYRHFPLRRFLLFMMPVDDETILFSNGIGFQNGFGWRFGAVAGLCAAAFGIEAEIMERANDVLTFHVSAVSEVPSKVRTKSIREAGFSFCRAE